MSDSDLQSRVRDAVACFWQTRQKQTKAQRARGRADQGSRAAVTGGRQMDGFIRLLTDLMVGAGVSEDDIFHRSKLQLPGYFRAEKKWDMLVVKDGQLVAVVEAKSQVGPSFGNNFNNRTEEAIGSALDMWTAYREGAFGSTRPFLGYLFLLEDCPGSRSKVRVFEPHFEVFPEFVDASYMKRYELLCRKLVLERHYDAAAFITSPRAGRTEGAYDEPTPDLAMDGFTRSLVAHVAAFAGADNA